MRAQEAAFQAAGPGADPRDDKTCQLHRHLPGRVHRRRGAAQAGGHLPILAPLAQPQKADRGQVLPPQPEHDHAAAPQAVQAAGGDQDRRAQEDEGIGRPRGVQAHERGIWESGIVVVGASYPFFVLQYLSRYDLAPIFNEEDFTHWFLPRDDIIQSYVVEGEKGKLTDMVRRGTIFGFENSIRRTFSQPHLPNRARYLVFEFYFTFPDLECHFYFLIRI